MILFTKPVLDCPEAVLVLSGTILYVESCIVLPGICTCLAGYYILYVESCIVLPGICTCLAGYILYTESCIGNV